MANKLERSRRITLPVEGMTCAACVSNVENALKTVPGVSGVAVNLGTEKATIDLETNAVPMDDLRQAVSKAGYRVGTTKATFNIGGMTCASCVAHVEHALARVPGVEKVQVNLATEQVKVDYSGRVTGLEAFRDAITDAGYAVEGIAGEGDEEAEIQRLSRTQEIRTLTRKVVLAGAVGTVIMALMYIPLETLRITTFQLDLALWLMATPVQFWAGRQFYVSAIAAARHRTSKSTTRPR